LNGPPDYLFSLKSHHIYRTLSHLPIMC